MIVYLKSFVINGVSLSVYVNVAHVCLVWCFFKLYFGGDRVSG